MDIMKGFVCLVVLSVLGTSWARQLPRNLEAMKYPNQERGSGGAVCTLCEEYASYALEYAAQNKTQTEIIERLHDSCSQLRSFKTECVTLVDYYAPLFFSEISDIEPEEFCEKVNLCQDVAVAESTPQTPENGCEICQNVVSEVLDKLKDPDTEIEIIRVLLKACDSAGNNKKKCKRMVFEYGPLIIANMEKFLETSNVCNTVRVCSDEEALPVADS